MATLIRESYSGWKNSSNFVIVVVVVEAFNTVNLFEIVFRDVRHRCRLTFSDATYMWRVYMEIFSYWWAHRSNDAVRSHIQIGCTSYGISRARAEPYRRTAFVRPSRNPFETKKRNKWKSDVRLTGICVFPWPGNWDWWTGTGRRIFRLLPDQRPARNSIWFVRQLKRIIHESALVRFQTECKYLIRSWAGARVSSISPFRFESPSTGNQYAGMNEC